MSALIRVATQSARFPQRSPVLFSGRMLQQRGDPGLFGAIGKLIGGVGKVALGAAKGFIGGGPLGAIGGGLAATGLLGSTPKTAAAGFAQAPVSAIPLALPGGQPVLIAPGFGPMDPSTAMVPAGPGACPSGFKLVRGIGPGGGIFEKCVKKRRMNPLNPQAASRAMRRLVSAKRAAKFLNRITIRSGTARSGTAAPRRSGCDCGKKKRR